MAAVIINPNSTASMTEAMVDVARRAAPSLPFAGWTSQAGPASIQGAADGEAAAPHLLELVKQASNEGAEGIIIGCFDDTALETAAQVADCPVIGLGQAAYHYAALRAWRFSVVTTLAVAVPILEDNIRNQGLGHLLAKVRASDVPVLALEADPKRAAQAIVSQAQEAEASDGIEAVVLGCAGMVQVMQEVQDALSIQTIDPVACAARCLTWLA